MAAAASLSMKHGPSVSIIPERSYSPSMAETPASSPARAEIGFLSSFPETDLAESAQDGAWGVGLSPESIGFLGCVVKYIIAKRSTLKGPIALA